MINIKKIGLTALTGSLVAFSANAAEMSVSGGVELTYTDSGGNQGNEVTGNSFGANSGVTLSASGDVGFGTLSATRAFADMGSIATSHQSLDMGDMGIFSFDTSAGGLVGVTANDDLLPTAYEEAWTGAGAGDGIAGVGSTNVIGYRNSMAGFSISAGYTNGEGATATGESASSGSATANVHGSTRDVYISTSVEGVTVGAGVAQNSAAKSGGAGSETEEWVAQAVYSTGPVSIGYRMAEVSGGAAGTAVKEITGYSIAFNVNENFAVSYGTQENNRNAAGGTASVTEDVTGISASYTVGAASVRFHHAEASNSNFVSQTDDEHTELGVVLAF
jgi:outer membrane protein OmpU